MDKPVKRVAVFGSFARNDGNENADIDLLINTDMPLGLFTLGRYISDLEDITRRKIDLATEGSLTPDFYNKISNDIIIVYAK